MFDILSSLTHGEEDKNVPRKVRIFLPSTPLLVTIRGNNKQSVFLEDNDYTFFLETLKSQSKLTGCLIHAYVLMPNHIHLLATPNDVNSLSKMMQGIGRVYVRYFNQIYNRSGTLWEGRYKSAIVDVANYLFACMKYIEQNPIRANLVDAPEDYKWSSANENSGFCKENIATKHPLFTKLGDTPEKANQVYFEALKKPLQKDVLEEIRVHVNKQTLIGSAAFRKKVEDVSGQVLDARDRGRPNQQVLIAPQWNVREKLMFKSVEVLDKKKYLNLKLIQKTDLGFARELNSVPVVASEVLPIGKNYPLVFTDHNQPALVALVAIGNSGNLAIDQNGKWIGDYAPAHLQNYPFGTVKAGDDSEKRIIVIDPESSLLSETEGEPIFDKSGEPTELFNSYLKALENYDKQYKITSMAAKAFKDAGILEDREISSDEGDNKKVLVKGFQVVSREKLNALEDAVLAEWVRKGYIGLIDLHLRSLETISALVSRSAR